jgi:ADP-ribose pyrophosphatase YjhB (NUDIX family)
MGLTPRSDLDQYPRPSVAVDVVVATLTARGQLGLLLHRRIGDRAGEWALPGRMLRERERLADAVARTLADKCHLPTRALRGRTPRQLLVMDDPDRDDRGWVLSIAHWIALPREDLAPIVEAHDDLNIAPTRQGRVILPARQSRLPYGQGEIVRRAYEELRRAYADEPDPAGLLGRDEFTLSELADVHFAVVGDDWPIDTFRRKMSRQLSETGEVVQKGPGRPAAMYRRPG